MKQTFCLFIAVVFLFGAAVVHGQDVGTLKSINCDDAESISFEISIPDIAEWKNPSDGSTWSLNSIAGCEPTFDKDSGLVQYSGIDVTTCAPGDPSATPDNSKFEYEFQIVVKAEAGSGTSPVTFAYDHNYVVKCFYNREQENIMASFQPRHSLTDSGSGTADFIIEFKVYEVKDDKEVTSIIDLRTPVYGMIKITDDFPQDLDVHLRQITADEDNAAGGLEFSLITNGCAVSSVVSSTSCDQDEEDRFYFEIFRFPGQTVPDKVYLRARVIVCLTSNTASICRSECTSCGGSRKRRDTLEEIQETEFYVTAGPFKIRDPDEESETDSDKHEGTAFPTYMIAIVAVCGFLVLAIACAVVFIVFRRRRQNVASVELQNQYSVTA